MKLLELFSGTGSVGNAMKDKFDEIVSLDVLPKCKATITADIMTWDYKIYTVGYFDYIWASPPCVEYSMIRNINKKKPNLIWADSIVQKTLEIINYFKPKVWFMENPQTGTLKNRPFMIELNLPFIDCDYCMFSDWGYRKRTRFWTNQDGLNNVLCNKQCGNMEGKKHIFHIGVRNKGVNVKIMYNKDKLHRIPEKLIKYLFQLF